MGLSKRASELAIESLAGTVECLMAECREQKHEMDNLRESVVQQRAMRQEDVDSAAQANADMSDLREDRDRLLRKLAQAEGHNDILRGQVEQLQAELTKARIASLYLPDDWRKTVAENLAAQKRFEERRAERERFGTVAENLRGQRMTADEVRQQAIVEEEAEYERTARGEPTTDKCPDCGGDGGYQGAQDDPANYKCPTCKGTGKTPGIDEFISQLPPNVTTPTQCPACHGTGKMMGIPDAGPCGTCQGKKLVDDAPGRAERIRGSALREADENYCLAVDAARRTRERVVASIEADYAARDDAPKHLDTEREGAGVEA